MNLESTCNLLKIKCLQSGEREYHLGIAWFHTQHLWFQGVPILGKTSYFITTYLYRYNVSVHGTVSTHFQIPAYVHQI